MMQASHTMSEERRGVVLVAVLVVVVLLSLAAYQYSELMLAEAKASANAMRAVQAKALADSGVHYAAALLSNADSYASILNGRPFDHAEVFADVTVPGNDPATSGRFSLIAPGLPGESSEGSSFVHGVQDEAGKINLNAFMKLDKKGKLLYDALMKLPNMTDEVANSIVDWLDADSEPRNGGAENEYYGALQPSYRAKNGPLDSLEELLLVKGVTPELLFGNDRNRNGFQDEGEVAEGSFDRGWSAFLTIYSREQLIDGQGSPLAAVNGKDLAVLYDQLSLLVGDDLAKFILLYRQYGNSTKTASVSMLSDAVVFWDNGTGVLTNVRLVWDLPDLTPRTARFAAVDLLVAQGGKKGGGSSSSPTVPGSLSQLAVEELLKKQASKKIGSLFDLVNAQVTVPGKDKQPSVVYSSPLNDATQQQALLPKLFKAATTFEGTEIPARINVNTAPREVLLGIPGVSEADADAILANRHSWSSDTGPDEVDETLAWLLLRGKLKVDTLKNLEKYVTTRTQVYRVQSIGFFDSQAPSARVEAVIDTNAGRPRVLYWRDLTELGKGFAPEKQ
jgi:type II secretory pathway component PulK